MSARRFLPRALRTPLRHWLLLCVVVLFGQISAPALAWCLHDTAGGAHLESALSDCLDHVHRAPVDSQHPCHDTLESDAHLMLDAQTPGASTSLPALLDTMTLSHGGLRLSLDEWLVPSAGPTATEFLRRPAAVHHSGFERLVGQTTHLLI